MKYLTFIRHPESYRQSPPPPALMEALGHFTQRSRKEGILVDTGGLLPSKDGARVRLAQGKITVTGDLFGMLNRRGRVCIPLWNTCLHSC